MQFEGRCIVVTGGGGGLGQSVVRWLAARGAEVTVPEYTDRSDLFDDLNNVTVVPGLDLTDEDVVTRFYGAQSTLWASVHLAGGFAMSPVLNTSLADFEHQIRMNLVTAFLCSREAVRSMSDGGRIVNVTARPAVETAVPGMLAYTTSKGAVAAMTRALAAECLSKGILVNAIAPSIIDTPANRAGMPSADFGTWPKPEELAQAIGFLISPENRLTNGAIVPVYGQA
ncbi:MAG: SDR family oxidoreductase [Myxococcota bacterium]|nr:SDR family oxidoreductase [Myxococcota bacterium]